MLHLIFINQVIASTLRKVLSKNYFSAPFLYFWGRKHRVFWFYRKWNKLSLKSSYINNNHTISTVSIRHSTHIRCRKVTSRSEWAEVEVVHILDAGLYSHVRIMRTAAAPWPPLECAPAPSSLRHTCALATAHTHNTTQTRTITLVHMRPHTHACVAHRDLWPPWLCGNMKEGYCLQRRLCGQLLLGWQVLHFNGWSRSDSDIYLYNIKYSNYVQTLGNMIVSKQLLAIVVAICINLTN